MDEERIAYVVDDEAVVRRSVVMLLDAAGFKATAFESGESFLAAAAAGLPFGCLLLDLRMPGMDGLAVQREPAARGIDMPVVVITAHGDVPVAVQAMKLGAVDFIEKPYDGEALLRAAGAALAGGAERQAQQREAAEAAERLALLTPRESEVVRGLVAGRQNKEIARDLQLSPRTVEVHRANAMEKLGARSVSEAVRLALVAGIAAPAQEG
ncbi:response regulator transcription factor [Teichococcus aestuarii]|uniref:DNA-binding response regulator n=1 Tax=Teichococcus aestuarii TaxID=568898 RepID=A0A2U1UYE4_9PROT|nr:response regulator [Pseudoroseomonas aestuarii]PWC26676.1 DNA-binding response regulator [Pseudoroseomonas aestuarii]